MRRNSGFTDGPEVGFRPRRELAGGNSSRSELPEGERQSDGFDSTYPFFDQANRALYLICVCRMKHDRRTQDHIARRLGEGLPETGAMRCVERYIAREIIHALKADLAGPLTSTGPPRDGSASRACPPHQRVGGFRIRRNCIRFGTLILLRVPVPTRSALGHRATGDHTANGERCVVDVESAPENARPVHNWGE